MPEVAASLAGKSGEVTTGPYAFFGHSLGAIVAFETIRVLLQAGRPAPVRLFISGSAAPRAEAAREENFHCLPDDQFVEEVGRLGGLPPEAMADPELRQILLPGLRADYALAETYSYEPGPPLPCPISVFHGRSDPFVDPSQLPLWGGYTTGELTVRTVPGDHFFLPGSADCLHRAIREDLNEEVAPGHAERLSS
jgi:surfactin synthase thioesterase subunit